MNTLTLESYIREAKKLFYVSVYKDSPAIFCGEEMVGFISAFESECINSCDSMKQINTTTFECTRTISLKHDAKPISVRLRMDFTANYSVQYWMIPGISYNGNYYDKGLSYRGWEWNGIPLSFAWHRTAIPCATYSEGNKYSIGMFAETNNTVNGMACSIILGEGNAVHRVIFPQEEQPYRILSKIRERGFVSGKSNTYVLHNGETINIKVILVMSKVVKQKVCYKNFLDTAWEFFDKETTSSRSCEEIWKFGVEYFCNYLWEETSERFRMGLRNYGTQWEYWQGFQIGWVGRNGQISNLLLKDYLKYGNMESYTKAVKCLDQWVALAPVNDSPGFEEFNRICNDVNNLGAAADEFLMAYKLTGQCGVGKPEYLRIAQDICKASLAIQHTDGSFRHPWCEKGYIATQLIPPLIHMFTSTKDKKYLDSAINALKYYMNCFYKEGRLWGATLDTEDTDSETSYPMIEAGILLYEITGQKCYLEYAEDLSYYHSSWQITHSFPAPEGTLFDDISYDTFGGTIVATIHMCEHVFGLEAIPAYCKLAEHTRNPIWIRRARALWSNATQGISDGTLSLMGRSQRPVGSSDETYNYTDWGDDPCESIDIYNPRGSASQWLPAWMVSLRMKVVANDEVRKSLNLL